MHTIEVGTQKVCKMGERSSGRCRLEISMAVVVPGTVTVQAKDMRHATLRRAGVRDRRAAQVTRLTSKQTTVRACSCAAKITIKCGSER